MSSTRVVRINTADAEQCYQRHLDLLGGWLETKLLLCRLEQEIVCGGGGRHWDHLSRNVGQGEGGGKEGAAIIPVARVLI
jgi:hypothetical protein